MNRAASSSSLNIKFGNWYFTDCLRLISSRWLSNWDVVCLCWLPPDIVDALRAMETDIFPSHVIVVNYSNSSDPNLSYCRKDSIFWMCKKQIIKRHLDTWLILIHAWVMWKTGAMNIFFKHLLYQWKFKCKMWTNRCTK